jgi:Saposin-like type B, region 1/Saposin-like type B, region 2
MFIYFILILFAYTDPYLLTFIYLISADIECGVCTYLVGLVEDYVANNKTETEILDSLEKDCDLLHDKSWIAIVTPSFLTPLTSLPSSYLLTLSSSYLLPLISCLSTSLPLYILPLTSYPLLLPYTLLPTFTPYSPLLLLFLTYSSLIILFFVPYSSFSHCSLHSPFSSLFSHKIQCQGAVATYGPEIISLVVKKYPADAVCTEIGLCSNSSFILPVAIPSANIKLEGNSSVECDLCQV